MMQQRQTALALVRRLQQQLLLMLPLLPVEAAAPVLSRAGPLALQVQQPSPLWN
jgi:hypothetical protein